MNIALTYNSRPENLDRRDPQLERYIEGDEWKTIEAVGQAIEKSGHHVTYYAINPDIYEQLRANKSNIDLLFNLAEGMSQGADREAHIPFMAEILGIPHTGPTPLSSALILNKTRAKEIWQSHGIATTTWQLFNNPTTPLSPNLSYPLIVKPNSEGSGIGIKSSSIVNNDTELKIAVTTLINDYHSEALVETLLTGREFTVAIIGNSPKLTVLPIVEINFAGLPNDAPAIDSYEAKFVYGATGEVDMHSTEFCPANLTPNLKLQIEQLAISAYTTIGCCDFGRLDIRLDNTGIPYVMEINHPPGLMSDPNESSFFTIAARAAGLNFDQLIGNIIDTAVSRLKSDPLAK